MTAFTATVRTHRRTFALIGTIVAIAITLAVLVLLLFTTGPAHDMNQVVSTYHHMPHFLQDLFGAHRLGA